MEMKRKGAAEVLEKIKSMTRDQELEYWRKRTQEMLRAQKKTTHRAGKPKFAKPSTAKV